MSKLLQLLGVLAEILMRVLSHIDQKKQAERNEQIQKDPVASFERRFGELQPDTAAKATVPSSTASSSTTHPSGQGTGDLPSERRTG